MVVKSKNNDEDLGEGSEDEGKAKSKRRLPLKPVIFGLIGLVVLGGGAAAAYLTLGALMPAKSAAMVAKPAVYLDVPEVLVNLSNTGGDRTQYLKVRVVLELADATLTT